MLGPASIVVVMNGWTLECYYLISDRYSRTTFSLIVAFVCLISCRFMAAWAAWYLSGPCGAFNCAVRPSQLSSTKYLPAVKS